MREGEGIVTPIEHLIAAAQLLYPLAYEGEEMADWPIDRARKHAFEAARNRAGRSALDAIAAIDDLRWSAPDRIAENAKKARRVLFAAAETLA